MSKQALEALKQALQFFENGDFVYPTKIATDLRTAIAQLEGQSMTDAKLLELAAKSLGYVYEDRGSCVFFDANTKDWLKSSPLTDGGAALQLAVNLGMKLDLSGKVPVAILNICGTESHFYESNSNKTESICRAIVRAAAEIGAKHE